MTIKRVVIAVLLGVLALAQPPALRFEKVGALTLWNVTGGRDEKLGMAGRDNSRSPFLYAPAQGAILDSGQLRQIAAFLDQQGR